MKQLAHSYANAFRGLSASSWWLSAVMLVNRMGTMVVPFMTLYMTQARGVSISKAGFVMTVFGIGAICGAYIGGKLTDRFGFYYIQLFSLAGGGIMFILLSQVEQYSSICLVTFLLSLVNEAFRPANASAVAHFSAAANRARSYSLNRLAVNLGWAVGGSLGGFVAAKSYYLLFWIDGLTNLSAALLLWILLAPSKNKATPGRAAAKPVTTSAYKDKTYLLFVLLNTLFAFCFFQSFSTIPLYFKQHLLLSETQIGLIMAINGIIIAILEMFLVHRLEGRRSNMAYIQWGTFFVMLSFISLNVLPGYFVVALAFILLITIGEMVAMPFQSSYWIGRAEEGNRGQYAALYTMSWAVAQVSGPGLGSLVAEYAGFHVLWWMIAAITLVSIAGYRRLQRMG